MFLERIAISNLPIVWYNCHFPLPFPAVTVCNMNAIKESNLHLSQELSDLLSDSSNRRLKRAAPDGQNNENLNEVPQGNLISTSNREKRSNTPYNEEKAQIINKSRKKRSTGKMNSHIMFVL